MLEAVSAALANVLSGAHLMYMLVGVGVGLMVGVLPGLGGIAGMSILLPFVYGMSGWPYLAAAVALGVLFVGHAWRLWRSYSDTLARRTFRFSILHLSLLFAALLADHYITPWIA